MSVTASSHSYTVISARSKEPGAQVMLLRTISVISSASTSCGSLRKRPPRICEISAVSPVCTVRMDHTHLHVVDDSLDEGGKRFGGGKIPSIPDVELDRVCTFEQLAFAESPGSHCC